MYATNPRRLKELRYIRMRAIGASARAATAHAGWHPHSSHLIERRLKAEVEARKSQLRGNGKTTWTISRRDVHRVLWHELGRLADHFGPHAKRLKDQALRALARQVKLGDASEHHKRISSKLSREAKTGGPLVRTLKMRELCVALITEIGKLNGVSAAAEDFSCASSTTNSKPTASPHAHAHEAGAPPQASAWCPRHPSQPRNACRLCGLAMAVPAVPETWSTNDW
jgi:hypothetical protein